MKDITSLYSGAIAAAVLGVVLVLGFGIITVTITVVHWMRHKVRLKYSSSDNTLTHSVIAELMNCFVLYT